MYTKITILLLWYSTSTGIFTAIMCVYSLSCNIHVYVVIFLIIFHIHYNLVKIPHFENFGPTYITIWKTICLDQII